MTAYVLPNGRQQYFTAAGVPLAGGKVYTYDAGTSNPRTTWADAAQTTPNANPVVLDARGEATIFWSGNYKIDLKDSLGVSITGYPVDNVQTLTTLPDTQLRADLAAGVAGLVGSSAIVYVRTAREIAAGITPTDYSYPAGHILRYGGVGNDTANDATAITSAMNSGHRVLGGGPEYTYRVDAAMTPTGNVDIDLQGATLKPYGNIQCIVRDAPAATATTTVSSGATQGSRSVVVASAIGIAVGQWYAISADDSPTHDASSYPVAWGKIEGVAGTTITLDRPLSVDYSGTITFRAHAAAQIFGKFYFRNGVLDGSQSTYNAATGQGVRVGGFEDVIIDNISVKDWDNNASITMGMQVYSCVDARIRNCRATGTISQNEPWDIQGCRIGEISNCIVDGSSFGGNITGCEFALVADNEYIGRRKKEADEAVAPVRSVRGIKVYGCYEARIEGNHSTDFESPIKVQACFRFLVDGNVLKNSGLEAAYTGTIALNVGSIITGTNMQGGIISNNIVENCGGIGIGVSGDTPGKVIITGNQVRKSQGIGIYGNVNDVIITGNRVEDWGLRNAGDVGIYYSQGATVTSNRLRHNSLAGLSCLRSFFQVTYRYDFRDNVCETANPLGVTFEATGTAQINSGSTASANISHTLSRTPAAGEITFTPTNNPTNNPGNEWVSGITSTVFVLNCRADPGASNATFGWRAAIAMPFTA